MLFDPLVLRDGVVARNRIWLAPLTNMQSHADGTLSDDELRFLSMRAIGGLGLVETCAAHVSQDGKAWAGELGVHDDAMLPGLTRLASAIHEGGALASAQLFHGGLRASEKVSGLPTWSASAYEEGVETIPRAGTEEDIAGAIESFARAAERCAKAGFDAIELHGAHGYLLSQFLSTVYNRRTDRWGGSLENRARLIRMVLRAVRDRAPSLVRCVRLSPEDFGQTKGIDVDEAIQTARWLVEDGMEVLHLSLWRAAKNTTKYPEQHPTRLFRDAVGDRVRIVTAGRILTRADAEAQLALGADAVALGRAAIANHDWPKRVLEDRALAMEPVTEAHLHAEGLSPTFAGYMKQWKGFVAG
jgi:2,4-dienoyl-CoA reductase-like NADH-dependent reductase (Old Yellow Enzyme family)